MNNLSSMKKNPWPSISTVAICWSFRPFLSLVCLGVFTSVVTAAHVEELRPRPLYSYRGFQNAQLFHVQIPPMTSHLRLSFAANVTEGCDFSNVSLYFRHNGLPIINLNNYSYPMNTSINRPSDYELMFISDKVYHDVIISEPQDGELFIAGFLLNQSDRIQQEGLVRSCTTMVWGRVEMTLMAANNSRKILENVGDSVNLVRHSFPESLVVKWNLPGTNDSLVTLESGQVQGFTWSLLSPYDLGGTLKILVQFKNLTANAENRIYFCIKSPTMDDTCDYLNGTISSSLTYIPFPISGIWRIDIEELQEEAAEEVIDDGGIGVLLEISLEPCFDSKCGSHGKCVQYFSTGIVYSTCVCTHGYKGWGCTDDSNATRDGVLLASVLLLTLSNLFFIPAIILAFRRRFYPQCLLYLCTMLFSTFYHACDQESFSFCILPYRVLQFGDFFGALSSVWLTAIAASQLQIQTTFRETIDVAGIVVVAAAVHADATSFAAFLIPICAGFILVVASWVYRSYKEGRCFPGKRYLLRSVIPCALFALTGLVCFAFLETETNYFYVHSIWHICIALAIVFILPQKAKIAHLQDIEEQKP